MYQTRAPSTKGDRLNAARPRLPHDFGRALRRAAVMDRQIGAAGGEGLGERPTQPATSTGYQGGVSAQSPSVRHRAILSATECPSW